MSSIPSAQRRADGEPRFHVPAQSGTAWTQAVAEEEDGGVEADTRIFLDAQLDATDVLVDLAPGFGFVALSAATAPAGGATVLVYGGAADVQRQWQDAAAAAGGWMDTFEAGQRARFGTDVAERLEPQGRLFVHCAPADVSAVLSQCGEFMSSGQLVALCLTRTAGDGAWPGAHKALESARFVVVQLAEQDGQGVIQRAQTPITGPVLALPAELVGGL